MSIIFDGAGEVLFDSNGQPIFDGDIFALGAQQQFVLASDFTGVPNGFLLVSDSANVVTIAFSAQQAQQASTSLISAGGIAVNPQNPQRATIALINWAYVTLVAPIYTGPGSVAYNGQFTGSPPVAGDIVAYDPTIVTVNTDGTISSTTYGTAQAQYNDGTGWYPFTINVVAWDVNPEQPQQAVISVKVQAQPAITAAQAQRSSVDIAPISGIAIQPAQAQQSAMATSAAALAAIATQQAQQSALTIAAQAKPAITEQQAQQASIAASVAAQIGFTAQQGQQENIGVVVLPPISIAITSRQAQQGTALVVTSAVVAAALAQAQQVSADVIVPPAVVIAMTAQQGQQASMAPGAAQLVGIAAQQGQQNVIQISAAMRATFAAQQAQQALIVLPTSAGAIIASTSQQAQQGAMSVVVFPAIGVFAQQAQVSDFAIIPLPAQLQDIDPENISFEFGGYLPSQQDNTKVIYLGRDNSAAIGVLYSGLPLDLGAVTQIQVEVLGPNVVIDSNSSPEFMSWTPGSNAITFRLGSVTTVVPGIYPIALVIYDYAHPDGQTIAGPGLPLMLFDFEQDRVA